MFINVNYLIYLIIHLIINLIIQLLPILLFNSRWYLYPK